MDRYHINPETGRPNKCSATVRPCPLGSKEEHYGSKEDARKAYEFAMRHAEVPTPQTREVTPKEPSRREALLRRYTELGAKKRALEDKLSKLSEEFGKWGADTEALIARRGELYQAWHATQDPQERDAINKEGLKVRANLDNRLHYDPKYFSRRKKLTDELENVMGEYEPVAEVVHEEQLGYPDAKRDLKAYEPEGSKLIETPELLPGMVASRDLSWDSASRTFTTEINAGHGMPTTVFSSKNAELMPLTEPIANIDADGKVKYWTLYPQDETASWKLVVWNDD